MNAIPHHETYVLFLGRGMLLATARALGALARRLRQPAVLGELLARIVLGPSVLGTAAPGGGAALSVARPARHRVRRSGSIVHLSVPGGRRHGVDLAAVRRRSKTALGVSLGGLSVPFAPAGVTDD